MLRLTLLISAFCVVVGVHTTAAASDQAHALCAAKAAAPFGDTGGEVPGVFDHQLDVTAALEACSTALAQDGSRLETHYHYGRAAYLRGDYATTLRVVRHLLQNDYSKGLLLARLAVRRSKAASYSDSGYYQQVRRYIWEHKKLDPEHLSYDLLDRLGVRLSNDVQILDSDGAELRYRLRNHITEYEPGAFLPARSLYGLAEKFWDAVRNHPQHPVFPEVLFYHAYFQHRMEQDYRAAGRDLGEIAEYLEGADENMARAADSGLRIAKAFLAAERALNGGSEEDARAVLDHLYGSIAQRSLLGIHLVDMIFSHQGEIPERFSDPLQHAAYAIAESSGGIGRTPDLALAMLKAELAHSEWQQQESVYDRFFQAADTVIPDDEMGRLLEGYAGFGHRPALNAYAERMGSPSLTEAQIETARQSFSTIANKSSDGLAGQKLVEILFNNGRTQEGDAVSKNVASLFESHSEAKDYVNLLYAYGRDAVAEEVSLFFGQRFGGKWSHTLLHDWAADAAWDQDLLLEDREALYQRLLSTGLKTDVNPDEIDLITRAARTRIEREKEKIRKAQEDLIARDGFEAAWEARRQAFLSAQAAAIQAFQACDRPVIPNSVSSWNAFHRLKAKLQADANCYAKSHDAFSKLRGKSWPMRVKLHSGEVLEKPIIKAGEATYVDYMQQISSTLDGIVARLQANNVIDIIKKEEPVFLRGRTTERERFQRRLRDIEHEGRREALQRRWHSFCQSTSRLAGSGSVYLPRSGC